MSQSIKKLNQKRRGQGMTEYVIIVALIAIAAIGVISLFGDNLRHLFGQSSNALNGQQEVANTTNAVAGQTAAKSLANFSQTNTAQ